MVLTRDEAVVKEKFLPKLARVLAQVPFAEDLLAAYYCAFDRGNAGQGQGHPARSARLFRPAHRPDAGHGAGPGLHR